MPYTINKTRQTTSVGESNRAEGNNRRRNISEGRTINTVQQIPASHFVDAMRIATKNYDLSSEDLSVEYPLAMSKKGSPGVDIGEVFIKYNRVRKRFLVKIYDRTFFARADHPTHFPWEREKAIYETLDKVPQVPHIYPCKYLEGRAIIIDSIEGDTLAERLLTTHKKEERVILLKKVLDSLLDFHERAEEVYNSYAAAMAERSSGVEIRADVYNLDDLLFGQKHEMKERVSYWVSEILGKDRFEQSKEVVDQLVRCLHPIIEIYNDATHVRFLHGDLRSENIIVRGESKNLETHFIDLTPIRKDPILDITYLFADPFINLSAGDPVGADDFMGLTLDYKRKQLERCGAKSGELREDAITDVINKEFAGFILWSLKYISKMEKRKDFLGKKYADLNLGNNVLDRLKIVSQTLLLDSIARAINRDKAYTSRNGKPKIATDLTEALKILKKLKILP